MTLVVGLPSFLKRRGLGVVRTSLQNHPLPLLEKRRGKPMTLVVGLPSFLKRRGWGWSGHHYRTTPCPSLKKGGENR